MSTYPIVLVTDHRCYREMYWTQNSGILLNTDGDEYAEISEKECLSQVLSRRLCRSQIFLASSAFTVENIQSRSLLIALSFLSIVYSPDVFCGQTFLKVIAKNQKPVFWKSFEVYSDRGEASICTCQPLFYSCGTGNSLLVSHRKEKDTFALIMTGFLKYEVILQYKLFTLLDIPTQYSSTQKV